MLPTPALPILTPSPFALESLRVTRVRRELPGVFTLSFDVSDRPDGFGFEPGQFNMLYWFGVGEVPISISGDPDAPNELVHTIRAVGGVTRAMEAVEVGQTLGVRGPYGTGWPLQQARGGDVVFVAGGLGLAPLRPAILRVLARREEYDRVVILYGARSPEELLFQADLQTWRGRFDVELRAIVDRAGRGWRGPVGVVTKLVAEADFDPQDATAFVCGPEVMMRFCVRELLQRGVPAERSYVSMERSMKCGVGLCGHCQWGPSFVCKDGPVYSYARVRDIFFCREI